jgi:hypothetical protein
VVLVRGQLTLLVEERRYQGKDLLVVLLQTHTQAVVVVALDQSDLWELKQFEREMAERDKSLQLQVLACFTQGVVEVEQILMWLDLAAVAVAVMGQKQGQCRLVELWHYQTQVAEVAEVLQQSSVFQATVALELSSFVTLHHSKRLLPQQEALR